MTAESAITDLQTAALWRLKEARWVEAHRDRPPRPAAEHRWSLTETGARLARERLTGRTKRTGA
ncbi:hypothetical protein [Saccharopolyspora pogona]|uniref:hypothetical protein n=1 Tax=Saccharopolyspora pogona TaxID=333966 RepID=UPI0016860591|nr:hypothetical protein [Saccharopolyspora pogona]